MTKHLPMSRWATLAALGSLLLLGVGCKKQSSPNTAEQTPAAQPAAPPAAPTDDQISNQAEAKIASESALQGQKIELGTVNGVVTLTGKVDNEAARALAAADVSSVDGVKTVVNNLVVAPVTAKRVPAPERRKRKMEGQSNPPPMPAAPPPPPPAPEKVQTVAPPPPPAPPPVKTVTLAAGTVIPVRLTETLDSGTTQSNSVFHATLANDLVVEGMLAAPQGTTILGRVIDAKDAGHFSGSSELSLELTQLDLRGRKISLVTEPYTQQGKGRGKNTATKAGGGAALGAIIGALAGGGKGAAIGAVTGGGIGAGANGITRGQQTHIASETLVNFRLQSPVSITTSATVGAPDQWQQGNATPQLQQRQ